MLPRGRGGAASAVLGVAEQALHLGAVPVPVLDLRRAVAADDLEVGHDERVAVDGVEVSELVERQGVSRACRDTPSQPRAGHPSFHPDVKRAILRPYQAENTCSFRTRNRNRGKEAEARLHRLQAAIEAGVDPAALVEGINEA